MINKKAVFQLVILCASQLSFGADPRPSPPGNVLENVFRSTEGVSDPKRAKEIFDQAWKSASSRREKHLIQLVGDLEICLVGLGPKDIAYDKCALKPNHKRYGTHSDDLVIEVNARLRVGPNKLGPAVFCAV